MPCSTASSSNDPGLGTHSRKLIYELGWASKVVARLSECHPRGLDLFLALSQLSRHHLAVLLAANDPDYAVIRTFVHTLDKWAIRQAEVGPKGYRTLLPTTQTLSSLLRVHRNIGSDALRRYLTDQNSRLIIEEQLNRGMSGEPQGEPDILPFHGGADDEQGSPTRCLVDLDPLH